jgi:ribosomal protein S4
LRKIVNEESESQFFRTSIYPTNSMTELKNASLRGLTNEYIYIHKRRDKEREKYLAKHLEIMTHTQVIENEL